jgi:hypothetical protein
VESRRRGRNAARSRRGIRCFGAPVASALARGTPPPQTTRDLEAVAAYVCDSALKGRFPVAQGAALGLGHPPKRWFPGLKGRFQGALEFSVIDGVPRADARGCAEIGRSGVGRRIAGSCVSWLNGK